MGKVKKVILWGLGIGLTVVLAFVAFLFYQFTFVLTGPRTNTPFAEAHAKAVHTFVNDKGFGIVRFRDKEYFFEVSVNFEGEELAVDELVLVGASAEYGERYYAELSQGYWGKSELGEAKPRGLDEAEKEAIRELREKKIEWVEVKGREFLLDPKKWKRRIFAPILAQESCLKCHEGEVGDLLGAFDYHLSRRE